MGFLDSFNDSFKKERERIESRYSQYPALQEKKNKLNSQSDSILLKRINSTFISEEDRLIINAILISRGYTKNKDNGTYHRL